MSARGRGALTTAGEVARRYEGTEKTPPSANEAEDGAPKARMGTPEIVIRYNVSFLES